MRVTFSCYLQQQCPQVRGVGLAHLPCRSPPPHRSTTLSPVMLPAAAWCVAPCLPADPTSLMCSSVSLVGILPSHGRPAGRIESDHLETGSDLIWSAIAVLLLDSRMSCRLTFFKRNKALTRRTRHASMLV